MKLYTITIIILFIEKSRSDKLCSGIYFNHHYYELEMLREGVNNVRHLAINRNTNTLYFSFDLIKQELMTNIAYINLSTNALGLIDGVRNARTIAVDQMKNLVYIGGETGIYVLNNKDVPEKTRVNDNVLKMFFLNHGLLYYTTTRGEALRYLDGETQVVPELQYSNVDSFVIDNTNQIFFIENYRLYRIEIGTRAINTHEKFLVQAVTTDMYGNLYACASNGLYVYNSKNYDLEHVADLPHLIDLVFDANNEPIYAVADKIIRLKYKPEGCVEYNNI